MFVRYSATEVNASSERVRDTFFFVKSIKISSKSPFLPRRKKHHTMLREKETHGCEYAVVQDKHSCAVCWLTSIIIGNFIHLHIRSDILFLKKRKRKKEEFKRWRTKWKVKRERNFQHTHREEVHNEEEKNFFADIIVEKWAYVNLTRSFKFKFMMRRERFLWKYIKRWTFFNKKIQNTPITSI